MVLGGLTAIVFALRPHKPTTASSSSNSQSPPSQSPQSSNSSIDQASNNTKRQADIKSLYGQIESYYARKGQYPTLANLNDSSWVAANMNGLNLEAADLKDPEASSATIVAKPTAKAYSYEAKATDGGSCDNIKKTCTTYTLTATLSDGTTYTKQNLN